MSLQEQLLKAGLVSAEKLKQLQAEERKQRHDAKKSKAAAAAEAAHQAEAARERERAAAQRRERDRRLNLEREAQKKEREKRAQARQLLQHNRRPKEADAALRYSFMEGRYIRYVWVSPQQQRQLATGRLGIIRNADDPYDYPMLPREAALKLAALFPDEVLLLHPESDALEADDEWPE